MPGTVAVREYRSEAEMREHYAALRRKCFEPNGKAADKSVSDRGSHDVGSENETLTEQAWSAYIDRCKETFGTHDIQSVQQRFGVAAVSGQHIMRVVSEVTGYTQTELKGASRSARVARARQIACWLLVKRGGKSTPDVGRMLGQRDHTTILHACRRVDETLATLNQPLPSSIEGVITLLTAVTWPRAKVSPSRRLQTQPHTCVLCGSALKAPQ